MPVLEELGVFVGTRSVGLDAAADKDPQRGISSKGRKSGQDQQAEGEELGFHRNKRKENRRAGHRNHINMNAGHGNTRCRG